MPHRIVINCWGSYGDVYPYVGLAKALLARGHRPLIAAQGYYRQAVERESIDFAAIGPDVDPGDRGMIARIMDPAKGTKVVIGELMVPAVRRCYEALSEIAADADLLVGHPLTFAVQMVAEARGIPWISTVLAPLGFFSAIDTPVLPPAPWLIHLRGLGPWFGRFLVERAHRATVEWMEPVHQLRAELGLPRGLHPLFEGQFSPTGTLALFSRVLAEPQPDWPAGVNITGFVFYNGPGALDPALESFLDAGDPPVVFTLGSSAVGAAGRFYDESVDAAARLGVRAVLLTGGFTENIPARPLPSGMMLVDGAPHQLLFPRASAIVHQGGIGTAAQALRSGHPMLVVPHGHDQPDNAFRLKNLGVARTVFPRRYRAARVARELEQLLGEPHYRQRAAVVSALVEQEGGADAAAAAIERLGVL